MDKPKKYEVLDTDWKNDKRYKCCVDDPNDNPACCDCCYDTWNVELKQTNLLFAQVNEEAKQIGEKYKYITLERDKFKGWLDDLIMVDQLSRELCIQFQVIGAQAERICINSHKAIEAIDILFCMVRDLFEQVDAIQDIYNQIQTCITKLNREELPENSGIRKCLKIYQEKLDAVKKTRDELIKALMKLIRDAYVLHEGICSDYGLKEGIGAWIDLLHCDEDCENGSGTPVDPCKQPVEVNHDDPGDCVLAPKLTFPICNDNYYRWVKKKYEDDVKAASDMSKELVEVNTRKEGLSAKQASLTAALAQVDPKELCK